MTLLTICDVLVTTGNKNRVEELGGEIVRINERNQGRYALMDVQFRDVSFIIDEVGTIKIETSNWATRFLKEEHGNFYVQYNID
jgi:hypothetical protein